jgi:hypothetical protein
VVTLETSTRIVSVTGWASMFGRLLNGVSPPELLSGLLFGLLDPEPEPEADPPEPEFTELRLTSAMFQL